MTKYPGPPTPGCDGGDALDDIDRRLCALAHATGRLRLTIGELLDRLGSGGVRALGFPSVKAYAEERCGRSGRWAEEARCLARRLAELPELRRALLSGDVTWSAANLVARHADRDSEAELVACAKSQTLRALRERFQTPDTDDDADDAAERRTIEHRVDAEEAWAFERTKMLLSAVLGDAGQDELVEAALAETLTDLLPSGDGCRELERAADLHRWRSEARQVDAEVRTGMEAYFEQILTPRPSVSVGESSTTSVRPVEAATPDEIDKMIRGTSAALARHDLDLGRLAQAMDAGRGWRVLGYHSLGHFTRERLGWSVSSVRAKMALARRCETLPALGSAVVEGRLGFETAALVGRVANGDTVGEWVDRAEVRTVKHLREDIEVAGVLARTSGDARWLTPPDDETVAAVHDVERVVLGADQMSAGRDDAVADQMSAGPGVAAGDPRVEPHRTRATGRVPLRVSLPSDLADFWSAVRALHGRILPAASFFITMWASVVRHWTPPRDLRPFADIYRRDRYRCQSPVCRGRDVDAHHIVFRAHGGGGAPENLVALCGICHLELVHGHHLQVTGRAPDDLRWQYGNMVVRSRARGVAAA